MIDFPQRELPRKGILPGIVPRTRGYVESPDGPNLSLDGRPESPETSALTVGHDVAGDRRLAMRLFGRVIWFTENEARRALRDPSDYDVGVPISGCRGGEPFKRALLKRAEAMSKPAGVDWRLGEASPQRSPLAGVLEVAAREDGTVSVRGLWDLRTLCHSAALLHCGIWQEQAAAATKVALALAEHLNSVHESAEFRA